MKRIGKQSLDISGQICWNSQTGNQKSTRTGASWLTSLVPPELSLGVFSFAPKHRSAPSANHPKSAETSQPLVWLKNLFVFLQPPAKKIHQHRPQIAKNMPSTVHQHLLHPPKSAPNRTWQSISQKRARAVTNTSNSTAKSIPNCMPRAPCRQSRKLRPHRHPERHPRQHPEQHPQTAPLKHPAVNIARMCPRRHQPLTAPQAASQSATRTSTPNCMPAGTLAKMRPHRHLHVR